MILMQSLVYQNRIVSNYFNF